MRKIIIVVLVLLVLVGLAGTGRWAYTHLLHDSIATGEKLFADGQIHAATLEFRNAVRNHPENARAHVLLAQAELREGDPVAAEKELKQAQALRYPGSDLLPLLARAYLGQERFRDLLRDIPLGTLPPKDEAQALVSRSLAQIALGDPLSARASATAAERLDPTLADARLAEARILAASGEQVQALLKVDEALKLDPKLLEALGLKADLLREQGDLEGSVAVLDQAVGLGPALPRVRIARARLLLLIGEDDKASADLDVALKGEPRNAVARFLKALLLVRAKDWKGAYLEFQKIQPVLSQLPRAEYYDALVKANVNQLEEAAEEAQHYAARAQQDADAFRLLARIDLLMNKQVEAQEAMKRVTALGGAAHDLPAGASAEARAAAPAADSPESLTHLASQQIGAGDASAAAKDLEASLETPPRPADTSATQVLSALAAADAGRAQTLLDTMAKDPKADAVAVANLTGLVQLAKLDFEGARKTWEGAVKRWPTVLPLQINLARVLDLTDHAAESEKMLAAVLTAQPAQNSALRLMVEQLVAHGRISDALTYIKAARRTAPNALPLLVTEAALHAEAKDFTSAYATFDEVPLEEAQSPLLLEVRAQLQLAQGHVREASDSLRQILLARPGDEATRTRLIRLLVETKQPDEALRLAREGLALVPGNSTMMELVVGLVRATQGMDAALTEAATLRRDPLNMPAARLLKGSLYMAAGKYEDAVAAYQAELKEQPFSALVLATAAAMNRAGHTDQGLAMLRAWVASQPDAAVSDALAGSDISARNFDAAEKSLVAVLAERPNDAIALNNLAWIYQARNDPRARDLARRAYLLQPTPQSADTLGWVLLREGNTHIGQLLIRRAAASMPNDPTVLYHLAVALKAIGKPEEAAKLVTAVLNSPAKFDERNDALKLQTDLGGPVPVSAPAAPAPAADPAPAQP